MKYEILQASIKSGAITTAEWDAVEFDEHLPMKAVKPEQRLSYAKETWAETRLTRLFSHCWQTEIAWGEFSGPPHENDKWKNLWDFFRDVRYGKAFLDSGFEMAPLFQIVYEVGNYMRLRAESWGMYVLHEVGKFTIPTTTATVPSLIATFSTLLIAKKDIEDIAKGLLNVLKRSWGYQDLDKSNMAHVQ
ncbi:hypothetical protein BGZ82_002507 [Podila clonocystis]|nr:hypothetical protein BGZ82_002507 [Podila clonocystis]